MTTDVTPSAPPAGMSKIKADNLLVEACKKGKLEDAKKAVECGADINLARDGKTPLIWASIKNQLEIIEYLVDLDVDVNKIVDGETALSYAAFVSGEKVINLLIRHGAEVNRIHDNGETILCKIARTDNLGTLRALIEYGGAKIDYQTPEMKICPLYIAFFHSRMNMGEMLLRLGANWRLKNNSGKDVWDSFNLTVRDLITKYGRV